MCEACISDYKNRPISNLNSQKYIHMYTAFISEITKKITILNLNYKKYILCKACRGVNMNKPISNLNSQKYCFTIHYGFKHVLNQIQQIFWYCLDNGPIQ